MKIGVKSPEQIIREAIEDSGIKPSAAYNAAGLAVVRLAKSLDILTNDREKPVIWSDEGVLGWATWNLEKP